MCKAGRQSLDDDPMSGRPSTSINEDSIKEIQEPILSDRRITIAELEEDTGLSHGSTETIIHEYLQMNNMTRNKNVTSQK